MDASGKGVLEAAGLDAEVEQAAADMEEPRGSKNLPALLAWWDRYRRYREAQRKKPHTPGVWVVYFSLAALPLFGLGQSLIPVEEAERRRYVFWLMVYYVASGLGLLLTTSFLGLRRYLRQRKLKMPAAMTATWLLLGGGLIAVLMLLGALLHAPHIRRWFERPLRVGQAADTGYHRLPGLFELIDQVGAFRVAHRARQALRR